MWNVHERMKCPYCLQHRVVKTDGRVQDGEIFKCLDCGKLITKNFTYDRKRMEDGWGERERS